MLAGLATPPREPVSEKAATHLVTTYRPAGIARQIEVAREFVCGPEKAVPIVMVMHELVCSAIEHGFGDDGTDTTAVSLQRTSTSRRRPNWCSTTDTAQGYRRRTEPHKALRPDPTANQLEFTVKSKSRCCAVVR
jgi:two-component sensor histidine kinase